MSEYTDLHNRIRALELAAASRIRAYRAAAQTIPDAAWTVVQYNAESFDNLGEWDTTNYRFVPQQAGLYLVSAHAMVAWSAWTVGDTVSLSLYKNGVMRSRLGFYLKPTAITDPCEMGGSDIVELTPSDYIDIRIYIDRGAPTDMVNDASFNHVAIHRLS